VSVPVTDKERRCSDISVEDVIDVLGEERRRHLRLAGSDASELERRSPRRSR